jgi:dihydrofolate reductase
VSNVIWHVTMSVDGFIAGPDHSMEWAFRASGRDPTAGRNPLGDAIRDQTGAILAGRRWYDVATERYDGVAGIYGGAWSGPVFVLTHWPPANDPTVRFLSTGVEEAVATARAAAGSKNLEIFGANTAQQCLEAGLLDEIVIHLAPVLLGDGVRLYGAPGATEPVALQLTALAEWGQLVDMRFGVPR